MNLDSEGGAVAAGSYAIRSSGRWSELRISRASDGDVFADWQVSGSAMCFKGGQPPCAKLQATALPAASAWLALRRGRENRWRQELCSLFGKASLCLRWGSEVRVGNGLKPRHVDKYLSVLTTQLLPGETIKGVFRVLNVRPILTSFAVTEIRMMLIDGANRYFGHMAYYDLDQWRYDARKSSFTVVLNDGSGIVLQGIQADDGVFLTDFLLEAKELPYSDERFAALARRDQRNDIDHAAKGSSGPANVSDTHGGVRDPLRAESLRSADPDTEVDEFDFLSLDEPSESRKSDTNAGAATASTAALSEDVVERLERLSEMLMKGLLAEDEFVALKQRLLEG